MSAVKFTDLTVYPERFLSNTPKNRYQLILRTDSVYSQDEKQQVELLYKEIVEKENIDLLDTLIDYFSGNLTELCDSIWFSLSQVRAGVLKLSFADKNIKQILLFAIRNIIKALRIYRTAENYVYHLPYIIYVADYIKPDLSNIAEGYAKYSVVPSDVLYEYTNEQGIKEWGIYISEIANGFEDFILAKDDTNKEYLEQHPEFMYVAEEDLKSIGIRAIDIVNRYYLGETDIDYISVFTQWFDDFEYGLNITVPDNWGGIFNPSELKREDPKLFLPFTFTEFLKTVKKLDTNKEDSLVYISYLWGIFGRFIPYILTGKYEYVCANYMYRVYDTLEDAKQHGTPKRVLKTKHILTTPEGKFVLHPAKQRLYEV